LSAQAVRRAPTSRIVCLPLDVLVQVDAEEHAENAEETDFETKPECDLEKHQINRERRADSGGEVCSEDGLNCALRGHHPQDLSKDTPEQAADEEEYQQQPRRFSHVNGLLNA
jgi:hypothetical protein